MDIVRLNKRYFPASQQSLKRFLRYGFIPGQTEAPDRPSTKLVNTNDWLVEFFSPLLAIADVRYKVDGAQIRVVSPTPELHLNTLIRLRNLSNQLCKYGGVLEITHKDDRRSAAQIKPYRGDIQPMWEEGYSQKSLQCKNGTVLRLHNDSGVPSLSIQGLGSTLSAIIDKESLAQINSFFEEWL